MQKLREAVWALSFCDAHPEMEEWFPGVTQTLQLIVLKHRQRLNRQSTAQPSQKFSAPSDHPKTPRPATAQQNAASPAECKHAAPD